ncbi:MAG: transcription antitermination factor NusB [Gammaproteobacteria bacterium]|jgi:N utilization substance protein B|nr:transcription antitermination factor NusB [Gammaproteobacteria bacterium]MBQ09785.1 transcription antitermination factor NusB [Gammaproteobacteria bacterium]MDP6146578.1 transcription antitermination factor NusB [Gammaproteobacteria bacterium]HJL79687.1 transcription antitermination factor NusB [Gammaproteobacteria bacterium]HJM08673.1 transcription antitermination factor NusB [Gammaproteobacteria bacterium]|tara:strand:- start:19743 stop:20213 length:471 start_codon:yes stop_codon:yes gene_type:complete
MNFLLRISDNEVMTNKKSEKRFEGKGRVGSRQLLLQVLYQHQKNDDDVETLMAQSSNLREYKRIDQDYFMSLLQGIISSKEVIEESIKPQLDRPIDQIDSIERAILWIAVYEISNMDIPNPVVINEAIELAKSFGAETSFQYINAVLDSYCQSIKN